MYCSPKYTVVDDNRYANIIMYTILDKSFFPALTKISRGHSPGIISYRERAHSTPRLPISVVSVSDPQTMNHEACLRRTRQRQTDGQSRSCVAGGEYSVEQ